MRRVDLLAEDQRSPRRVGTIGLVVIALAIGFFVFVYDRIEWGNHVRVRVYFHATGGLTEGAPFVVAGREIGKVESIALSPQGAPGPLNGDEGVVAQIAIDDDAADTARAAATCSSRRRARCRRATSSSGPARATVLARAAQARATSCSAAIRRRSIACSSARGTT